MQILIQAHSFCEVNIYIHRGGLYIKEHLGFLQLINFLTCRVGVGVIFIKSTKSVNFNVKNAPNGWISWCRPTNV